MRHTWVCPAGMMGMLVLSITLGVLRGVAAEPADAKVQAVIDRVDRECRARTVYMVGPQKAKRLAELVRERRPVKIVECGTAIGYSGLWMARELQALGRGKLITIEIEPRIAAEARRNFQEAGLADYVEVLVGDARQVAKQVPGPIEFVLLDCNAGNYHPCFVGLEENLADGAIVVADNVGISESGMKDFLALARSKYSSRTEWFDLDVTWANRDAMEVVTIARPPQVKSAAGR